MLECSVSDDLDNIAHKGALTEGVFVFLGPLWTTCISPIPSVEEPHIWISLFCPGSSEVQQNFPCDPAS